MDSKNVIENFKTYNFPQRFFALIMLIQVSTFFVGIVIRVFFEFGWWPLSSFLYLALIILGVVIMGIGLFSLGAKTASYIGSALLYFGVACLLFFLVSQTGDSFFSIFSVGSSILLIWSSANLLISIIILFITLFRLIGLGIKGDYISDNDNKKEIARLRKELDELRRKKQQS